MTRFLICVTYGLIGLVELKGSPRFGIPKNDSSLNISVPYEKVDVKTYKIPLKKYHPKSFEKLIYIASAAPKKSRILVSNT